MSNEQFNKIRNTLLVAVFFLQVGLLTWEYFNGGIVTHHLLMRKDLPGFSNLWGLLILPLLVWLTGVSLKKRLSKFKSESVELDKEKRRVLIAFCAMFFVSLTQSIVFYLGFHDIAKFILLGFLLVGLLVPLYRLEYICGFVLGACITSGPAMPFVGVILFGTVSAVFHLGVKPISRRMITAIQATSRA